MRIKCKQQIAILLATYNGERYLREQIDSILSQSFTQWHLYVHDDGSCDHTLDILSEYAHKDSEKITILDYPSQGNACNNFFSLLEKVEAQYYMFSDQDDVWNVNKIQRCYEEMQRQEQSNGGKPVLIHSDLTVVDSQLSVLALSFVRSQRIKVDKVVRFSDYAYTNTVTGCTMLFNAETIKHIKHPRTRARMHDSWIAMSLAASGGIVSFIDEPLVMYRQHGDNTLGAKDMAKITFWTKLKSLTSMLSEIIDHYREMNDIKRISFVSYLIARIRYKAR